MSQPMTLEQVSHIAEKFLNTLNEGVSGIIPNESKIRDYLHEKLMESPEIDPVDLEDMSTIVDILDDAIVQFKVPYENPEREAAIDAGDMDPDTTSQLYGETYFELETAIMTILLATETASRYKGLRHD